MTHFYLVYRNIINIYWCNKHYNKHKTMKLYDLIRILQGTNTWSFNLIEVSTLGWACNSDHEIATNKHFMSNRRSEIKLYDLIQIYRVKLLSTWKPISFASMKFIRRDWLTKLVKSKPAHTFRDVSFNVFLLTTTFIIFN